MSVSLRKTALALAIAATAAPAQAVVTLNDGLDGTWYKAGEGGRGVSFDIIPQADGSAVVFGGVFSYDGQGNPVWLTFGDTFAAGVDSKANIPVNRSNGGSFGSTFTAPVTTAVGSATVTFNSCSSATVALDMNAASTLPDVTLTVAPSQQVLGFPRNSLCTETAALASCPAGTTANGSDCQLPASITGSMFLPAGKKYLIRGQVSIEGGATLTIAPGVTLQGSADVSTPNFLVAKVGGRLYAEGTPSQPIVFTGPQPVAGSWAGLVLAGDSTCNDAANGATCQFEAVPSITYGGNDLADSSGVLRYVRIQYAGQLVAPNEELNSLTLLGVGSGTVLDHVQSDTGLDDGFEMFGGSVNGRYLVCSNMTDDCFDFDQGYTGKIQFALAVQGTPGSFTGDPNGIESDNDQASFDKTPRTRPTVSNMTLVGTPAATSGEGARIRRGTGGNYTSLVITGYADRCLNLDDAATFGLGSVTAMGELLSIRNSHVGVCANGAFEDNTADAYAISAWYATGTANTTGTPELTRFLPNANSPLLSGGAAPSDPFFRPVSYKGAFAGPNDNWTAGWTVNLGN